MRSQARQEGDRLVEAQAKRQVQTFFDELKNGTRNYRTVASLSGQITQEYRGRCVLELLQNAHDALASAPPHDSRQISFVLATEPEPVLLIANSGRPFRQRDFEGICQLGQSPKDPNESVGNKGLGFQSVLEVSTRPQIWSTTAEEGDPEFVFGFDPAGTVRLVEQAVAEIASGFSTSSAGTTRRIVNWSEEQLYDYQRRDQFGEAVDAAREARRYVSPYSIPLPIEQTPPEVAELLDAGHVTVIRLRLDGGRTGATDKAVESIEAPNRTVGADADPLRAVDEAVASIKDQLDRLDARSVVFLPDLERLAIEIDGECRVLERIADSTASLPRSRPVREQVLLVGRSAGSASDTVTQEFRVWTRSLGGDSDPEEAQRIQEAVRHLPNRWPEVRQVKVGVAVEDTESPEPGAFVIFLPTEVATGTGAHINAPFYGSLDRRQINFEDEYNALLLEYVMDLALDMAAELVEGPPEGWRARAVIDLLASADAPAGGDRPALMHRIRQRAEETGHDIDNTRLVLCDNGWQAAERARIMTDVPDDDSIGENRWRENAGFAVVSAELNGRRREVEALVGCLGGAASPTPADWAATIERLAARIQSGVIETSWDAFLNSVLAVLPREVLSEPRTGAADPLSDAQFLPTQDDRLLSASGTVQVFFQPRREFDDAAELAGQIPDALRDRIAFLHRDVSTREGPRQHNTEVQGFLNGRNGRFVQSFGREDLLRDVITPALPELPARHGTPDAQRCSEILGWTALLDVAELEGVSDLRQRLPVACHGGWFPAGKAIFGPGWKDRHGACVRILADSLTDGSRRLLEKALLPPQDQRWGLDAAASDRLLEQAGVIDGLPTEIAESVSFTMSSRYRDLPRDAPSGTPQDAWDDWLGASDNELTPEIKSRASYRLDGIYLVPEIHSLQDLQNKARNALSDLILSSLGKWDAAWESARLGRHRYPASARQITSPLKHWLTTLPWLHDNELDPRPLRDRWYVPESLLRGQRGRFRHLAPLSLELAHRLGENTDLLASLRRLGLNVYPTTEDARTGPELLKALADAHERKDMPAGGFDVFLGQVRHAWRHVESDEERLVLPERFLVRTRARTFEIRSAKELTDVYLPDHSTRSRLLRDHRKPILEMYPAEARSAVGACLDVLKPRRASNLQERCLADGQPVLDDAEGETEALEDSELSWLPSLLLTLAAHGGARPRGPGTGPWDDAKASLRNARIRRCGTLVVEVVDAEQVVARSEPQAHWLANQGVLLICHGSEYEALAPACQAVLDRQDLLTDLRLVLGALPTSGSAPTRRQIETALDRAEIDAETFADICELWDPDAAHVVDRIRPVTQLLDVCDEGLDAAATDRESLKAWLHANLPNGETKRWSPERLISAAHTSRDDVEMGRAAFRRLGEVAQLPKWNQALTELGDRYATVENSEAADQAKRHIDEAAPYLQALARHVAVEMREPDLFLKLVGASEDFEVPAKWSALWWKVPLPAVLAELRTAADELGVDSRLVEALGDAGTVKDLRGTLAQLGIDLDADPYKTFRRNEKRLRKEIGQVHEFHRAWMEVSGADLVPPKSETVEAPQTDSSAYLREWSENEIFQVALESIGDADFHQQCERFTSIAEARSQLGVTLEAVERARQRRREDRREDERRKKLVPIAGRCFVDSTEDYEELLAHIESQPEPKGPPARADEPTRLVQPGPGPTISPTPSRQTPGRTSHLYSSPHLPGLVGIVGEIWAWRYLQSQFGRKVVTRAAWVSENGLKAQPLAGAEKRDASDRHGFDFWFSSEGITWHFEVKATTEDNTSFSLPPSEIRAATRLANSRRDRWRILRVRRALTKNPEIDLLPNPFEAGFSDFFRLSPSGLTVRYALDADP